MCVPGQRQSYLSSAVQGNSPQCAYQHGPSVPKSHGRSSVVVSQENLCSHSRQKRASSTKCHARAHCGCPGASSEALRSRLVHSALTSKSSGASVLWTAFVPKSPDPPRPICGPVQFGDCLKGAFFLLS